MKTPSPSCLTPNIHHSPSCLTPNIHHFLTFSLPQIHKDNKGHKGHIFFIPKINPLCASLCLCALAAINRWWIQATPWGYISLQKMVKWKTNGLETMIEL